MKISPSNNLRTPQRQKIRLLKTWLKGSNSPVPKAKYAHLWLKEIPEKLQTARNDLQTYFRSAYDPVFKRFEQFSADSLDPLGRVRLPAAAKLYPHKLNAITLQGYFGEVFAGIVAEHYSHFNTTWDVPIFLFHLHNVAIEQLERIAETGDDAGRIPGRTGDDCIAFELNNNKISKVMVCEAKCTTTHSANHINDNHRKLSQPNLRPVDLCLLIEALKLYKGDPYADTWIERIGVYYFDRNTPIDRYDLSCYVCQQIPILNQTCVFRSMPIAVPLSCRSLFRSDVDHHSADADHGGFLSHSV